MLAQLFIVKCLLHTLSSHFVLIIQSKSKKHLNLHFNYEEGANGNCRSSQVLQLVSVDVFISLICSQIGIQKAYLWWNSKQNLFIHIWVNWENRCCWGAYQIPVQVQVPTFEVLDSHCRQMCLLHRTFRDVRDQIEQHKRSMGYWDSDHQATLDVIMLKRLN